jgi:hypothetical protein
MPDIAKKLDDIMPLNVPKKPAPESKLLVQMSQNIHCLSLSPEYYEMY